MRTKRGKASRSLNDAAERERLMPLVIRAARDDYATSIGSMERLASISGDWESRRQFWAQFPPSNYSDTQSYLNAGMDECHRLIVLQTEFVALDAT